jgi:hypothetical protein
MMHGPSLDLELARAVALGVALAAACGLRIFLPLAVVSTASQLGLVHLSGELAWLGSGASMVAFGAATLAEVAAYHVPWLDNLLDHLGAPVAVVAGTVLAASLLPAGDPLLRWVVAAVAGGGAAGSVHVALAALRELSSLAAGGLANPLLAFAEAAGALLLSLAALLAPALALVGVAALAIFVLRVARRRARPVTPSSHPG